MAYSDQSDLTSQKNLFTECLEHPPIFLRCKYWCYIKIFFSQSCSLMQRADQKATKTENDTCSLLTMFQIPSLQVNQLAMSYFTNRKPFRGRVGINTQFCLQSTKAKMRTSHPCENYADAVQWWQMCPESKAQKKPHVTMAALSLHIIREKMTFYAET